jgi:uncharacterized protein
MSYFGLVIVTLLLGVGSQAIINSTYKKWKKVPISNGMTGLAAARHMLDSNGLQNVPINCISGELTDYYDPRSNSLNLSKDVYYGTSVASVAIACHEAGHAVQHANHYVPVLVRSAIVPVANLASNLWMIIFIIGIVLSSMGLVTVAIIMYACVLAFQLVTLPVEFNASRRAIQNIDEIVALPSNQAGGARSVLTAAAFTYVAAALASLLQLIYLLGSTRD